VRGTGTSLPAERRDDAMLAIDGVRRGQQLARGLAAHHVALAGRGEAERGIRLAAAKLLDRHRAAKSLDVVAHPRFERGHVEALLLLHLHRAGVLVAHDAASVVCPRRAATRRSGRARRGCRACECSMAP
jgi:hypothetical protein